MARLVQWKKCRDKPVVKERSDDTTGLVGPTLRIPEGCHHRGFAPKWIDWIDGSRYQSPMRRVIAIITTLGGLCLATCEKAPSPTPNQPPTFDQTFSEGLVIANGDSSIGPESLPDARALAAILNIWSWTVPVKLPDDVRTFSLRLDHYQHDQWISTLARSGFNRLTHRSQLGTEVPTEDEITIILRFPAAAASRELAATRSETGYLFTSSQFMTEGSLQGSEFLNPFFGKEPGLVIGSVPLPLELGTDTAPEAFKARLSSIDTRAREMSENFQIGVLHSNDGTNLRLTFSIQSRYDPPAEVSEENIISTPNPKTATKK